MTATPWRPVEMSSNSRVARVIRVTRYWPRIVSPSATIYTVGPSVRKARPLESAWAAPETKYLRGSGGGGGGGGGGGAISCSTGWGMVMGGGGGVPPVKISRPVLS